MSPGLSIGGIYSRVFAELYPEEVVGMVLVDSSHPEQEERWPPAPVNLEPSPVKLWLIRQSAAMGVLRLWSHLPNPIFGQIPPEMLPQLKAFTPQSTVAAVAEIKLVHGNLQRAKTTQSLGDRPLVVLTATKPVTLDELPRGLTLEYMQKLTELKQELHAELATLSSSSQHIISEQSGHLMYFDQPSLIIDGIHHVVDDLRRR
ncbi:MAG: alpha/beta hydrolase [Moorea sp. SIO3G5]|nr:alpha/beta hydrolase [Moorena sp. SIO3G5]